MTNKVKREQMKSFKKILKAVQKFQLDMLCGWFELNDTYQMFISVLPNSLGMINVKIELFKETTFRSGISERVNMEEVFFCNDTVEDFEKWKHKVLQNVIDNQ